jgi:hypothetical protein
MPRRQDAACDAPRLFRRITQPINTAMIDAMKASKYWISSNGLTPQATLYSAITREDHRGQFALRQAVAG